MNDLKKIAFQAAQKAGKILLSSFRKKIKIYAKGKQDIVTNVDKKCEKEIINLIRKKFPRHSFSSEETNKIFSKSDYHWVIDPLDGTINYASGQPLFSVSLCLLYKQDPLLGVVYAPSLKEFFYGLKNKGAFLNGKKISVSKNKHLKDSIIYFTLSSHYGKNLAEKTLTVCKKITPLVRGIRVYESGALSHCYLAAGRLEAKISIQTDSFSSAAGVIISQEAGGKVTDLSGANWDITKKSLLSSNSLIHKKLFSLIKR